VTAVAPWEVYNTASASSSSFITHLTLNFNHHNYNFPTKPSTTQPTTTMSDSMRKGLGEQASEKSKLSHPHV
jgi:hypothetical protein